MDNYEFCVDERPVARNKDMRASRDTIHLNNAILAETGEPLSKSAMILDFGCGDGCFTYDYLDAGFCNAFGYDVVNYLRLRKPEDAKHFRTQVDRGFEGEYPKMRPLPWPDATFDFVFATQVFEHVFDQDFAYSEIARVLKHGGRFLNIFPSKWRVIEPHMYVPFAGAITHPLYFMAFAYLGIRNDFQTGLPPRETARRNIEYSKTGVNYLSGSEIAKITKRHFRFMRYVEAQLAMHAKGRSRHLAWVLKAVPPARVIYRTLHNRAMLLTR